MEIFKENKREKWKHILNKLHKTKIADQDRLNTIKDQLDEGHPLYNADVTYIENTYKQLEKFQTIDLNMSPQKDEQKPNYERELQMIEQFHQKEIGNFSRLESIRNYLMDGLPLLHEDVIYLNEQYEQLKKVLGLNVFNYDKKSNIRTAPLEPQTILIDDVEEIPTHDFNSLSVTISRIIRTSTPHFTIGIYGEWGTGKTTLMKSIERNLVSKDVLANQQKILPIWFNAWKYEREENLATVSLLKTVAYAMANHEKFSGLAKTIFKGLTIVGKDMMQQIALQVASKKHDTDDKEIDEKMDYLNKLYRDSVYYEGLDKIREHMESIREEDKNC